MQSVDNQPVREPNTAGWVSAPGQPSLPRDRGRAGQGRLEVVALLKVGEESGLDRLPADCLPRLGARSDDVPCEDLPQEAEVVRRLLYRDRDHWQVEVPPDAIAI